MSMKAERVWKKFEDCFEITLAISNTYKMQKIEEHVYHLKVDIHKGCYGSIQCWKRPMPSLMNHWINSFMCHDCL